MWQKVACKHMAGVFLQNTQQKLLRVEKVSSRSLCQFIADHLTLMTQEWRWVWHPKNLKGLILIILSPNTLLRVKLRTENRTLVNGGMSFVLVWIANLMFWLSALCQTKGRTPVMLTSYPFCGGNLTLLDLFITKIINFLVSLPTNNAPPSLISCPNYSTKFH